MKKYYRSNLTFLFRKIDKKFILVIIITIFFYAGIIFGALTQNKLSEENCLKLFGLLNPFMTGNASVNYFEIFFSTIVSYFFIFFLIFLFGTSLIGIPFILLVNFYRGFGIGFTFALTYYVFGIKGLFVCLICFLPQAIITAILLFVISNISIKYSYSLIILTSKGSRFKDDIMPKDEYIKKCMSIFMLSFIPVIYETFFSTFFLKLFGLN